MVLPNKLIQSLQGVNGFNQQAFEEVHASGEQITSIRLNPNKLGKLPGSEALTQLFAHSAPKSLEPVPWSLYGYYLSSRPSFTFDPLFHAGTYYVQEASSMFLEQAIRQTVDLAKPLRVLDLCAAPGGKSTHLQSLLSSDSLLVSNEVIKSRAGILKQNLIKWGTENVVVTNNDPKHFARLQSFFDVMVVDAPCSGSGLFRRDEEAINEWSVDNVMLCCGRQKRIIADALDALKEGGVLIYSTCSYSKEEDEEIADWLEKEMGMENLPLKIEDAWGIVASDSEETASKGYRFFPDKVKGEGFFLSCFRKITGPGASKWKAVKPEKASAREKEIVKSWLNQEVELLKEGFLYAIPAALLPDYTIVKNALYIQYAGVAVGEVMKEKLVPDHALALSNLLSEAIPSFELPYDEAIRYLQKQEINIPATVRGWQTITFHNHNLGWINALQNRVNNYYPKDLRILKQRDNNAFEK